eukprot:4479722-Amphidinium_carterae.1
MERVGDDKKATPPELRGSDFQSTRATPSNSHRSIATLSTEPSTFESSRDTRVKRCQTPEVLSLNATPAAFTWLKPCKPITGTKMAMIIATCAHPGHNSDAILRIL